VPTLGKEAFAECQGCGTRQSWKKCCKSSHFPSFAECQGLALGKEVNFVECQLVPLGKDYFQKDFFFKKMVSLPSAEPWLSAKIQIFSSASPWALGKVGVKC
jgi:hypothetical protein